MGLRRIAKDIAARFGLEVRRAGRADETVVSLRARGHGRGDALLSYLVRPFITEGGHLREKDHTSDWRSWCIAQVLLDAGFSVDVIHYKNHSFVPSRPYRVFIDVHRNMEVMSSRLNGDCIKIFQIVWAHWLFSTHAEYGRCLDLQRRRGIVLQPQRTLEPHLGIEHADFGISHGNEFTVGTYEYAGKTIFRVPAFANFLYPFPEGKDFEKCRRRYLWLGSSGLVHKGLDLTLEAFVGMPDFHLTVCGSIHKEADFERAFAKELYDTPNITTLGFVDITSGVFQEVTRGCVGFVFPSCAEGGASAVPTCLHAGLIPIVSYESGVDVQPDFGEVLTENSVKAIREAVRRISQLPLQELQLKSRRAWETARTDHTRERFDHRYREVVADILARSGDRSPAPVGA